MTALERLRLVTAELAAQVARHQAFNQAHAKR